MLVKQTKKPKRISPSGLNMYQRCPLQYFYRYIEGISRPPAVIMIEGTATHRAIEKDLINKRDQGVLLPLDEVEDAARDALNVAWDQGVELDAAQRQVGEHRIKGSAVDRAVRLAGLHHTQVAPGIEPKRIEYRFDMPLPGSALWSVVGILDCQESEAHGGVIRDTKTKAKSPPKTFADTSDQLTAYAWAVRELDGKLPDALKIDALVSTKKPKHVQQVTKRDDSDIAVLQKRFARTVDAIEKEVFTPCPRDSWACSQRWCGYWAQCPFGAKQHKQVAQGA